LKQQEQRADDGARRRGRFFGLREEDLREAWRGGVRSWMMMGNAALLFFPRVTLLGRELHLLDLGGVIATTAMFGMAIAAAIGHTKRLYNEERFS
jgi:hypothetical protein